MHGVFLASIEDLVGHRRYEHTMDNDRQDLPQERKNSLEVRISTKHSEYVQ